MNKTLTVATALFAVPILMIVGVNTRAETINYNTTTKGIPDWLKRPDGTFCMNDKSPATRIEQQIYESMKQKFGLTDEILKMNPWPLLCSTPEDQSSDYYNKYFNPNYSPTIIPPSARQLASASLQRLLTYINIDIFNFLRTPFISDSQVLAKVIQFEKEFDAKGIISDIKLQKSPNHEFRILFPYELLHPETLAKQIFDKQTVSTQQVETAISVLMGVVFAQQEPVLFVCENRFILKKRLWLESRFRLLNIVTVYECTGIMDLFAKCLDRYYTNRNAMNTKKLWYWLSFRSKIIYYNVPSSSAKNIILRPPHILETFASRFTYLLMSVDEIGIQHYSKADPDIIIPYHFNYCLLLITGIFDSLAIETQRKYQLRFKGDNIRSRISLSNKTGKDFLKELKKINPQLRNQINKHVDFINMIYLMREIVTHREAYKVVAYYNDIGIQDFLLINNEIAELVKKCGDQAIIGKTISRWGLFNDIIGIYISAYHFARAAASKFVEFSNEYLRLLGFTKYENTLNSSSFRLYRLGF